MPLYPDWINAENIIKDWLHFKFKFQIFKFKTASTPSYHFAFLLLRLPVFLATYFSKLINIFVFILVDAFGFPVFWFHKDGEITKNLFTLGENSLGERKLSCTRLSFGEILFAGTKRTVPGGQHRSILSARGSDHIIKDNYLF